MSNPLHEHRVLKSALCLGSAFGTIETQHSLCRSPLSGSGRLFPLGRFGWLAIPDATNLGKRCAQDFSLRREPMSVCVSILTPAFDPKVIGAFADCLIQVLHEGSPFP
jgi:hypothetical protein